MRIIAIASQKGGTGKTTTTRTLGAALAAIDAQLADLELPQGYTLYDGGYY